MYRDVLGDKRGPRAISAARLPHDRRKHFIEKSRAPLLENAAKSGVRG